MWIDCEKNSDVIWYCESQCKRNFAHIATHIVRRLWGNCEWRWIPLAFTIHIVCKIISTWMALIVDVSALDDLQCNSHWGSHWVTE